MSQFQFSNRWFESTAKAVWEQLLPQLKPARTLEVGSYEGASTCFLIEKLASTMPLEIHCADTWQGGIEHQPGSGANIDMAAVETRFKNNIHLACANASHDVKVVIHRGLSDVQLPS